MIWFSCRECGKTHGRPETAIGATIFCDCGTGLIVPWESTAAEPPQAAAPENSPALKLEPVTFEAAPPGPAPPSPGRPTSGPPTSGPPSHGPPPLRGRKRARVNRRDPAFCFNHEQGPREASCGDCGESFCGACLVAFDGADLCGPCKNYRVKNLQRAIPASNLSIVSLLVALLSGPITIGLLPTGRVGFPWWTLIAPGAARLGDWPGADRPLGSRERPEYFGAVAGLDESG